MEASGGYLLHWQLPQTDYFSWGSAVAIIAVTQPSVASETKCVNNASVGEYNRVGVAGSYLSDPNTAQTEDTLW